MFRCTFLALALLIAACSPVGTKTLADGGTTDAGPRCGIPAPPTCTAAATLDQTFAIDSGGKYEIVSSAAYDGTLWVAYSRGDTSGATANFQVWLTRIGCDGSVLLAPVQVSTDMANDVDPVIAVSDGVVLVAWLSDSGQFPNNLTIKYRLYGASDAAALSPDQLTLLTTRDGQPVTANMLDPSVSARFGGGFVIAGTRSTPDETAWQAFAQPIDAAGANVSPTIDGDTETDASHKNAVVTSGPDGTLYLAWARESKDGNTELPLMHTSVAPDATTAVQGVPVYHQALGTYPTISGGLASCARPYLTFEAPLASTQEVMVLDATSPSLTTPGLEISLPNLTAVGPHVAASDDGGAVAWMAQSGSPDPLIFVQRFTYDGTNWQLGKRVQVMPMEKFALRPPSLTRLSVNTYLVTWVEGTGAETYTYGRLLSLDD